MPEGDTLHRHAAELRPLLVGKTLVGAWEHGIAKPSLTGREVRSVEAVGKHLVIELSEGAAIHLHLGMYGRIARLPASQVDPRRYSSAQLTLKTASVAVVVREARTVELLRSAFLRSHPAMSRLGPDLVAPPKASAKATAKILGTAIANPIDRAADPAPDPPAAQSEDPQLDEVIRRARALQSDRSIGELLLDQRAASGIGNVYKSELLFIERVNPFAPAASIDDATLRRLYQRARELLARNLGPWLRTTTADRSRGQVPARGVGRHYVYRRRNRACYSCGTAIASRPQGDSLRMTYYCPRCQRVG